MTSAYLKPQISVVMPAYRHEVFIGDAIRSVLSQTLDDWELIIIDDASPDSTWEVINSFHDPRLRIRQHKINRGAHHTLNEGLSLARGEYIAILNSDDIFHEERLVRTVARLERGEFDLVGTDIELINESRNIVRDSDHWWILWYGNLKSVYRESGDVCDALLAGNLFISSSNFVFRRSVYETIGGFGDFRYVHDYEFLLRALAQRTLRLAFQEDEKLLFYRLHGANTIRESALQANRETFTVLNRWFPESLPPEAKVRGELFCAHMAKIEGYIESELRMVVQKESADRLAGLENALLHQAESFRSSLSFRLGSSALTPARWLRRALRWLQPVATASNVHQLERLIEGFIGEVRFVSFDVFDTLVARRIDPPELVHDRVAEGFAAIVGEGCDATALLRLRRDAENELRTSTASSGGDYECHHDDLLALWVQKATGAPDPELVSRLRELELRLEIDALRVKRGVPDLLARLKSRGVRLLAISDMYLGCDNVTALLRAEGIADYFDRIYVSADGGLSKGSGRLFAGVLEEQECSPTDLLHVGDNLVSDYHVPRNKGVHVIHLHENPEIKRRALVRQYWIVGTRDPYWRGRCLLQVANAFVADDRQARGFDHAYGREVLGPLFCTAMLKALERIREIAPSKVYFLARDGYLLQVLYRKMASELSFSPVPDVYLHISRKVAFAASIADGLQHEQAVVGLYNPSQKGLLSILKTFGLEPDAFKELARRHGFIDIAEPLADRSDQRLLSFLNDSDVQELVQEYGTEARNLLEKYLDRFGFFDDDDKVLMDIGWNGTIQYGLEQLGRWRQGSGTMWGLYLGFCAGIPYAFSERSHVEGLIYDERRVHEAERLMLAFEEVFEEGARASHATTVGYREAADQVVPILKSDLAPDRARELACNGRVQAMQGGVLDFAADFISAIRLTGFNAEDIRPFMLTLLERAMAYPTPMEVRALSQLAHADDFGQDSVMDFSGLRPRRVNPMRWRRYKDELRTAPWIFAMLRGLPRVYYRLRQLTA